MNRSLAVVFLGMNMAISVVLVSRAAEVSEREVDQLMGRQMTSRRIPGASVAIIQDGKPVLAKGYGLADVELKAPADKDTVYELGSLTKQFTSTAIMILIEEGQLSLDEKIGTILAGLPEAWDAVTVRHLLNHTSGIKNYSNLPEFLATPRKDYENREILALVSDLPLEFSPGTKWNYSNTGYYLLGMVIEKKSGMKYDRFVSERIFKPLSMTSTRVNSRRLVMPGRAKGYVQVGEGIQNAEYQSPAQAFSAGAVVSSVVDLAKWEAAFDSGALLEQSTIAVMRTPTTLRDGQVKDYGFGWDLTPYRDAPRIGHDGEILGFSTYCGRFVDDKLIIIVLVNLERGGAQNIAESIAELYLPALRDKAPKGIEDKDPKLTVFLHAVVENVADGHGEKDWFTPKWREFFFPDRIKEGKQLLGAYGPLNSFVLIDDKVENGRRVRGYNAVFGTVAVRINLTISNDGKVDGMGIQSE